MWQSLVGFCFVIFDIRPISQDSEIKPQGFLTNQSYQTTENVKVGCRLLNMSCSVVKTTVLSKAQRKRNICFIISVFKSLPDFRNARNTQEILGQFKNTLLLSVCFEAFVLFYFSYCLILFLPQTSLISRFRIQWWLVSVDCLTFKQNLQQYYPYKVLILIFSYSVRNMAQFQISTQTFLPQLSLHQPGSLFIISIILLKSLQLFWINLILVFCFRNLCFFRVSSCLFRKAGIFEEQAILLSC